MNVNLPPLADQLKGAIYHENGATRGTESHAAHDAPAQRLALIAHDARLLAPVDAGVFAPGVVDVAVEEIKQMIV